MGNLGRHAAAVLALLLGGCATATLSPSDPPTAIAPPLEDAEIQGLAELLEMEDRRRLRLPAAERLAAETDDRVRARTAMALARIGDRDGRPLARVLLGDPDSAVAATAAFALGQLRDSTAIDRLLTLLAPPRDTIAPTVAAAAATALGRIGTPDAVDALANYLLGADTVEVEVERNAAVLRSALLAGAAHERVDSRVFARWLNVPDPVLRRLAAEAVVDADRPGSVQLLIPLLDDPDPDVRAAVLPGLTRSALMAAGIAVEEVSERVVELLSDSVYAVQIEAIRTASTYRLPAAAMAIYDFASGGEPHERVAAIEAVRFSEVPDPALLGVLRRVALDPDDHPHVRSSAVAALVALEGNGLADLVYTLVDDPSWRVRAALGRALTARGDPEIAVLLKLLRDNDVRVARATLDAFMADAIERDSARYRSILIELAQAHDVHVRATALQGLGRLTDLHLFPILLDAYDAARADLEVDAQLAAIDAIADLSGNAIAAPERAFFARFGPSQDERVRRRVHERFGAAAERHWGVPLPVESPRTTESYRAQVDRWLSAADPTAARPQVVMETDVGEIRIELLSDLAPLTTANFLALAEVRFFDGQEIARVIPNRRVDAGTPGGDLAAGPGYTLRAEVARMGLQRGWVAMANGEDGVHGSRFFVTLAPGPTLPGEFSVFGRVVSGLPVLERLLEGDRIVSVRLVPEPAGED